jgi:hypothetical protein
VQERYYTSIVQELTRFSFYAGNRGGKPMRRFIVALLSALVILHPAFAQGSQWCGYSILTGLNLLDSQLGVLAALTPAYNPYSSAPDTLFQTRWNTAHTEVIIEGCFSVLPSQEVIVSLLDSVLSETADEINATLAVTLVAPDQPRDVAAAVVKQYILENRAAWGEE